MNVRVRHAHEQDAEAVANLDLRRFTGGHPEGRSSVARDMDRARQETQSRDGPRQRFALKPVSGFLLLATLLGPLPARSTGPLSPSGDQGGETLSPSGDQGGETLTFVDRTEAAGLRIVTYSGGGEKNHILESTGNGVLVLDYDLDGDPDLYFVAAHRLPRAAVESRGALYRNNGDATFTDVTEAAGVAARGVYGHGGCVGDFDGDGLPDLYLTAVGPNVLYRNEGDGTLTDVTEQAGVGDAGASLGATFFDADADGDQDLFVANYIDATWEEILSARRTRLWQGKVQVMDGPRGLAESRNTFYRNQGDGTFEEATEAAGFTSGGRGYSMGVVSFDYDDDGDVDVYVANDSTPNRLYRNRGDGTFEEVGTSTGSAYNADGRLQGSMGVHFGDYDGDGWPDLVVTQFARDYNTLYRNLGGLLFQDDSFLSHLAGPGYPFLGWGAFLFDADNDADLDLFVANGHIYPQVDDDPSLHESYRQRNQLLLNDDGKFRELDGDAFSLERSSRGAVFVDYDNDGDLDLAVSNQDERPTLLENRTGSGNHWVTLEPLEAGAWTVSPGARVEVVGAGRSQARQSSSGGSYASHNDPRLHVGLGPAGPDGMVIDRLTVTWPDGARTSFFNLAADRFYRIRRATSSGN